MLKLPPGDEEMAVQMPLALGMTEIRVGCIYYARLPPITFLEEEEGIHAKEKP